MNRTSTLLIVALAVSAATVSALGAGSTFLGDETTTATSDSTKFSLTVKNGNHSGNYTAGTLVTVSADAPKAGSRFAGWTGDVEILADPFIPTTTATIPYMAVTITATYTAPATTFIPPNDPSWGG